MEASFKNTLVISDNVSQFKKFIDLLHRRNLDISSFTFHCSIGNESFKQLANELPSVTPIDLNQATIYILNTYDLILSLHCMQIFPAELIDAVKCINIHPGYNPMNRGWYPQVFAIIYNLPTGATIHEMSTEIDNGPIIARKEVPVYSHDTSLSVYQRICEAEMELLNEYLILILENKYTTFQPESEGHIFYKKDFQSLCKLDLNTTVTMKSCIDLLRALSHGEYNNAYFYDQNNNMIFVRLILEKQER